MLSSRDYIAYYNGILTTAEDIALEYQQRTGSSDAIDYFKFLCKHGYTCFPADDQTSFRSSGWLDQTRQDPLTPSSTGVKRGIGLILSVHGDWGSKFLPQRRIKMPNASDLLVGASGHTIYDERQQLVVVGDVDFMPHKESAVTLLHEARHARNHFGPLFNKLQPLEPLDVHEAYTWDFELKLLDAIGGDPWQRAVEKEVTWLRKKVISQPGWLLRECWAGSSKVYPELNEVFGPLKNPAGGYSRAVFTSIAANVALRQNLRQDRQTAVSLTVNGLYKSGKQMLEENT